MSKSDQPKKEKTTLLITFDSDDMWIHDHIVSAAKFERRTPNMWALLHLESTLKPNKEEKE